MSSTSDPRPPIPADVLQLGRFVDRTVAEGPGERTALWVQGCTIRCTGCFNPHLWTFRGGTPTPTAEVLARVLAAETDGLTLLGGEPFDHAAPLALIAAGTRAAGRSVMTFSGYTTAQLHHAVHSGRRDVAALLDATDLLIAGPYVAALVDRDRPWAGSTNQEFVERGSRFPDLLAAATTTPDRLEITVAPDGTLAVNGWADDETLDALLHDLARPRPRRS
ncbi:4Fe-4S single cluster domain-containing protein [Dactylosporangium matsuzakiense]|uniref:Radical SAM protein n=1 Tax=Dactylosporangium matsuzakiense TaxID=53360 RepID=A0A9W6NMP7_9ACTN|nr:4Fe-4S single cluster domain-containing protein [Dactylosporangium matsuzakiense]UWZ43246.1 radical SAM protein [Dactylosporangium matsuzakiense]GLL02654.1 radical SAM protein [Dactylosporangium matsuzakiense]